MLPESSASIGLSILFAFLFVVPSHPRGSPTVRRLKSIKLLVTVGVRAMAMIVAMSFFIMMPVWHHQSRKHGRQQGENQRLNRSNEQFQKIEGQGENPAQPRHHVHHGFKNVLTREDIPVKTEAQGNRSEGDGHHLDDSDEEENGDHEILHRASAAAFTHEDVLEGSHHAQHLERPPWWSFEML